VLSKGFRQFAIFYFFHRCSEQPYNEPNAIVAQLKLSLRMSILRRVPTAGAGAEDFDHPPALVRFFSMATQ
jgi:hypothetical protein